MEVIKERRGDSLFKNMADCCHYCRWSDGQHSGKRYGEKPHQYMIHAASAARKLGEGRKGVYFGKSCMPLTQEVGGDCVTVINRVSIMVQCIIES